MIATINRDALHSPTPATVADRDITATIIMSGINGGRTASQIAQDLHTPDQAANVAALVVALDTITEAHVRAIEERADREDAECAAFDRAHADIADPTQRPRLVFA